ncbi:COX15/CtaA family protein [Hamadaea sp.]|uniref:COX15/CtaA family protein n=1 Tax=Hamadaea sp. TaxID=2024425 RepID=UPI0025BB3373|nr:COX15/CtaA family protein [Hamadaea sp.]
MGEARGEVWAKALRGTALASLAANVGIVVTGGAVRLTGSGLGCPTWPKCTAESLVATREMGINGAIEFGNRLLTFVVAILAILGFLLARQAAKRIRATGGDAEQARSMVRWSFWTALSIPAQAAWGGLTVLTDLNPWVVGLHFMVSIGIIWAAFGFWRSTEDDPSAAARRGPAVARELRWLAGLILTAAVCVLVIGTMVTGSGPHAGDQGAARNGLDPAQISQVHADLVFLLFGLTAAAWLALRAVRATEAAAATLVLLGVLAGQGVIGFVQYFTHLQPVLVGVHMFGASLVWIATLRLWWAVLPTRVPRVMPQQSAGRSLEDNLTVANPAGARERS